MRQLYFSFLLLALSAPALPAKPAARPKILGISFVRLKSTDLDKSSTFYSQIIGLPSHDYSCKDLRTPCFSVNSSQHLELVPLSAQYGAGFLDEIGLATDDLPRMRAYLEAHRVPVSQISIAPNGVRFFEFSDPEGNRLAFTETSPSAPFTSAATQISNRLIHAGFVVKNLAAENHFYLDLLGFRLYWHGGFKDQDNDWYEIQVPDGNNWLEYMLNISPSADHKELGIQNHFSLGVSNVRSAADRLHANGATTFDGPEVGRDGKNSLDIYDPDLTRVEVMDFTPTKDPCCHPYTAPHPIP